MPKKTSLRMPLLSLGLSLLLAGWMACKPAADKAGTAGTPSADSTAAGTTATGSPAAPGQLPGGAASTKPANPADAKPMDAKALPAVVAKVDGRSVSREDLLQAAQAVQIRLAQQGQPVTPTVGFYRQVLDEVVGVLLLQKDAKASGVTATEQEIEQQLAVRKRNFPDEATFKKALAKAGLTEAKLRQQTSDQIAVQKYLQSRMAQAGGVTEQATREFYEKNKAKIQAPERLRVRHILVQFNPQGAPAEKEKARQKAADLLKRAQAGEDFAKLATENSEDPSSRAQGGELGWMAKGQTPPPFEQAAFALKKPNDLSPVVESQLGFHIIQLEEHAAEGTLPYDQVKERIGQLIQQQQAQQQLAARVRELRSKSKVEVFL